MWKKRYQKMNEFVMKSVINKSGLKVFIIQNIDKKIPLETIARMKEINMLDLLHEMETIVSSGTKLNLDYCISDYVDEYDQDDMYDFFQSSESGNHRRSGRNYEGKQYQSGAVSFDAH
jgi:ATP-dependent DNA helicase RecQ